MKKEVKLIGYQYADGVHWHWIDNGTDKEVAVINDRGEIEWCVRTYNLPEEVVAEIRNKVPRPSGTWLIEARRIRHSVTQGTISIFVNGNVLHGIKQLSGENPDPMPNIVFSGTLIAPETGIIYQKYILFSGNLSSIVTRTPSFLSVEISPVRSITEECRSAPERPRQRSSRQ